MPPTALRRHNGGASLANFLTAVHIERVDVAEGSVGFRLRTSGLGRLMAELDAGKTESLRTA